MAIKTFENGLRVVCSEKTDANLCSVVVHITGGCQSEKNNQSGVSEYVSRLLLCGTKNYPTREELLNYAKLNGIILKSHAARESITISAVCASATLNYAMELLAEIIFDYNFDASAALRVKNSLLADIEQLSENHSYNLEKSVNQALFSRTGLANAKYGSNLTVERFNAEVATEFMQKLVTPKNTIISVVGNVDTDEVNEYAEEYFVSRLPEDQEYKKIKYVSEVENFEGSLRTRNKRLNQSRICVAFPTISYKNTKKYLPQILKPILFNKVQKALRLQASDYYDTLNISSKHYANNGKICFDIIVDYDYAEMHLKNLVKTLKNLFLEDAISEHEFELEKNLFLTKLMYKYDNVLEESLISAKEVSICKHAFNLNSEKLKIEMLTVKDANKYISQTFKADKMFVSYLGHPIDLTFDDLVNV